MRRGAEALTGAALLEAHGRRLLSQAAAAAEARRVRRGRLQEKRRSREREREREVAAAAAFARSSSSSSSLSPSARPFTPASPDGATAAAAASSKRRRTPPRGAAAVGDGDRALSDAASVRAQVAAAMASVLDQGAVLVAPALPGPPPLKSKSSISSRKGRKGKEGKKNSSSAVIASSFSRWAQGVAGLGTLAALSGLPRLIVPLPVAEAAAKLFPSSGSSDSSSSFVLPAGPPPCVALLGGKGSDGNLINVGARLAPVLAEEFVKAVAAGRARAAAAAEGGSINGADEEEEQGATATRRKSRRATAASTTTATAGASPAVSLPASPAKNNNNSNGNNSAAAAEIKTEAALAAEALRDAGNAAFRSGDFLSAVAHYSAAAAADPTCPLALSNRAAAHLKLLEYEAAERDATLALQLKSDQPKALLRRGTARAAMSTSSSNGGALVDERRERQLLAGARGDLEAVLALEPGNRQARAELEALEVMMRVKEGGERDGIRSPPKREEAATATKEKESRSEIEPADEEEEKRPTKASSSSSAPPSPSMPQEDFFV